MTHRGRFLLVFAPLLLLLTVASESQGVAAGFPCYACIMPGECGNSALIDWECKQQCGPHWEGGGEYCEPDPEPYEYCGHDSYIVDCVDL